MKISVCMASYNGAKYIKQQIDSILMQLKPCDELIISDDGSNDGTLDIINSYGDDRIILLNHKTSGLDNKNVYSHYLVSANFENALNNASGDIILLADQDDVWCKDKIEVVSLYLKECSLVLSDCSVINEKGEFTSKSFLGDILLPRGLIKNIISPRYHGCCMGFRREVLDIVVPFPPKLILHDSWIGILAEIFGKVKFIDSKLVLYRRHYNNTSYSDGKSKNSIFFKVKYRIVLIVQIVKRFLLIKSSAF